MSRESQPEQPSSAPLLLNIELRDYFAAQALCGFCGSPLAIESINEMIEQNHSKENMPAVMALLCYEQADALLAAREAKAEAAK